MAKKRKNFLDLQAARKWAVAQQLSGKAAWAKLKRETGLPTNIPSNPQATYGEEFKRRGGWGWFLGTGNQRPEDMIWISFLEARAWARESIAKSQTSWVKASKTPGWLPNGIPANPPQVYRKDWTSWGDFLGTGNIAPSLRVYVGYEEASRFGINNGYQSSSQWFAASRHKDWPENIPKHPHAVYGDEFKNMGGWGAFLGTGNKHPHSHKWRTIELASAWAKDNGISSSEEWFQMYRNNGIPKDIPCCVHNAYGDQFKNMGGWRGFLGTGPAIASADYATLDQARRVAASLGLKNQKEWTLWAKKNITNDKYQTIPRNPQNHYGSKFKDAGGWGWFLGTGNKRPKDMVFLSMKELSEWASSNGIITQTDWRRAIKPLGVPANPAASLGEDFLEAGGWDALIGERRHGVSRMEVCMEKAMSFVFAENNSRRMIAWGKNEARSRADYMNDRDMIAMEYDGSYYHKNREAKDRSKTEAMTMHGYTVIRVREADLRKLHSKLDLVVDGNLSINERVKSICQHLLDLDNLGLISMHTLSRNRAAELIKKGMPPEWAREAIKAKWLSIDDAAAWARKHKISSQNDWAKKIKTTGFRPRNIPACPPAVYGDDFRRMGGWGGFLGTGALGPMERKKLSRAGKGRTG